MKLKHYWNLLTGKIKLKKPATLSIRNILAVLQSFWRSKTNMKKHIVEQIIWRRIQVEYKAPDCWEAGHCTVCGCELTGKTMEDRACSNEEFGDPCYPAMMNEEEWNVYKILNKIKYFEEC
jgi:hypothetical protein